MIHRPSPHFNERQLPVDTILLHYTDMPSAQEALSWLTNPSSQVSAHYLIDEEGGVYALVDEGKRAWHAGESYWQGCTDLNSCSIGIELANPGHSHGYRDFPHEQIDVLIKLCKNLQSRWSIPCSRILGHSDVAPRRKQDPGHLFPWERLAKEGVGSWPRLSESEVSAIEKETQSKPHITELLAKLGYETVSPQHALLAFQRHFQPQKLDGIANEETYFIARGLLKLQGALI